MQERRLYASRQLGPKWSACDGLPQRQVYTVQSCNDSICHSLQAEWGKQERNPKINDAAHRVADEEQPHAQQCHNNRGRSQEEGGHREQEQQNENKDGQQNYKRRSNKFWYQSYIISLFLPMFYHAGAGATMLQMVSKSCPTYNKRISE